MGFGGGSPPPPPPPPPAPPKRDDPEIKAREEAEKRRVRKMKGRSSTILTGAGGVSEEALTGKKSLLGQ